MCNGISELGYAVALSAPDSIGAAYTNRDGETSANTVVIYGSDRLLYKDDQITGRIYIDNNYMKELMVEDLLPLAHLSRSRFHAVFAAEAGCSFKAYLNRLRIAQAERALAATALPVTQIALGCGYNSLSQFYAAFRALHGGSPCRFRREAAAPSPANPSPPPFHGQRKA